MEIPEYLIGFYSTALCSLHQKYEFKTVYAFDVSDELIKENIKNDIVYVYEYYSKIGITVKKVKL
ncbi:hypothetical protein [Photobacterium damselae]|uniref:hypothetical protein n=1 Tax=Photobacterium damselae TaxID=38293 RepID=UPI001F268365|nr:hypothetical protein [Photobacterium damselae]UKA29911.1 hypothetical protein IPQ37_04250 [Photobacterium damselae subsp. damselae]